MGRLKFDDDFRLFDRDCVRFRGWDGEEEVLCGVTDYALQHCDPHLPKHGLISSDEFLAAFERLLDDIQHAARKKHAAGLFEKEGPIMIMVHRQDLAP